MDLTTCVVAVVAGSAGGAISGYCVGRCRRGQPARRAGGGGSGRAWPGQRRDGGPSEGPYGPGGAA